MNRLVAAAAALLIPTQSLQAAAPDEATASPGGAAVQEGRSQQAPTGRPDTGDADAAGNAGDAGDAGDAEDAARARPESAIIITARKLDAARMRIDQSFGATVLADVHYLRNDGRNLEGDWTRRADGRTILIGIEQGF